MEFRAALGCRRDAQQAVRERLFSPVMRKRQKRDDIDPVEPGMEIRDFARMPGNVVEDEAVAAAVSFHDDRIVPGIKRIVVRRALKNFTRRIIGDKDLSSDPRAALRSAAAFAGLRKFGIGLDVIDLE